MILPTGKNSIASIKENISDISIRFKTLNDRLDFRIIDMGDLYYSSQSKADYDQLIERLKKVV